MTKTRSDAWSSADDALLVETLINHVRNGGTQLQAFEKVGDKLKRTSSAVGFRWNGVLRGDFQAEYEEAKEEWRQRRKRRNKPIQQKMILDKPKQQKPKPIEDIKRKEYKGERVVTLKDVDEVHGRPEGTASRNFSKHKERFIEGEDYYNLKSQNNEIRGLEVASNRGVVALTESGYLMLVKSFTDDLSWKVQRQLVKSYFKIQEIKRETSHSYMIDDPIARAERWIEEQKEKLMLEQRVAEYEPKVTYYDKILQSPDAMTVTQIAKDYGLTAQGLNKILHEKRIQYKLAGQWLLYKEHANQGYTKSETHSFEKKDGTTGYNLQTKWTQKGRLFIHNILTELGYDPDDFMG